MGAETFIIAEKGVTVDLKELQQLSVLQTKAGPKSAKPYLERIRKNLMTLMCQTDVVNLIGDLNAFGGDKDVTTNIGKAVLGLFCVGSVLGVDVALGIEKLASDTAARLAHPSGSSSDKSTDSAGKETGSQADPWTTGKKVSTEPDASSTESKGGSDDSKARKIENYRNALRHPKHKAAIELVWKSISEDRELSGQDKYQLQNEKKEALKRVAA